MSFFISDAMAEAGAAAAPQADPIMGLLPFVILFVVFYFFLIRPQSKRVKEHKKLLEGLSKGDEVVTNGGMLGLVKDVGENFVTLQVAEGVDVKVQKQFVANVMPKGTLKSAD